MKRIVLATLFAAMAAAGCANQNGDNDQNPNQPSKLVGGSADTDPCATVRCANGPCVVKSGVAICTDASGSGGGGATTNNTGGAVATNGSGGSGGSTTVDACAAVRCANGPCVVKDGKPVCQDSSPSDPPSPTTDACSTVRCAYGPCVVVNGKASCPTAPSTPDAAAPSGTCKVDADCVTYVDYCGATCGVCRGTSDKNQHSTCQPPSNVRCADACRDKMAICKSGQCVVQ